MKASKGNFLDRVSIGLLVLLLFFFLWEIFWAGHKKPAFFWHGIPGYSAVIGLGGCLLLVKTAKALGAWFLQKPEKSDED